MQLRTTNSVAAAVTYSIIEVCLLIQCRSLSCLYVTVVTVATEILDAYDRPCLILLMDLIGLIERHNCENPDA